MNSQRLSAVNVVVKVVGAPRRNNSECIDCRVWVKFESREPQYYHVIIPKNPEKCTYMIQGRNVDVQELSTFIQDGVWLHVVGTSMLHYKVLDEEGSLQHIRERPELYAHCEVHLVASMLEAVHGGL